MTSMTLFHGQRARLVARASDRRGLRSPQRFFWLRLLSIAVLLSTQRGFGDAANDLPRMSARFLERSSSAAAETNSRSAGGTSPVLSPLPSSQPFPIKPAPRSNIFTQPTVSPPRPLPIPYTGSGFPGGNTQPITQPLPQPQPQPVTSGKIKLDPAKLPGFAVRRSGILVTLAPFKVQFSVPTTFPSSARNAATKPPNTVGITAGLLTYDSKTVTSRNRVELVELTMTAATAARVRTVSTKDKTSSRRSPHELPNRIPSGTATNVALLETAGQVVAPGTGNDVMNCTDVLYCCCDLPDSGPVPFSLMFARPYISMGGLVTAGSDKPFCSGALVGNRLVLTAAHCFCSTPAPLEADRKMRPFDDAAHSIYFDVGRNGVSVQRFKVWSVHLSKKFVFQKDSFDPWFHRWDWALLVLADDTSDWSYFGFGDFANPLTAHVTGYPELKYDAKRAYAPMWDDVCPVYRDKRAPLFLEDIYALNHRCDTQGGSSGGPVWYEDATNGFTIKAVHSRRGPVDNIAAPVDSDLHASIGYFRDLLETSTSGSAGEVLIDI